MSSFQEQGDAEDQSHNRGTNAIGPSLAYNGVEYKVVVLLVLFQSELEHDSRKLGWTDGNKVGEDIGMKEVINRETEFECASWQL